MTYQYAKIGGAYSYLKAAIQAQKQKNCELCKKYTVLTRLNEHMVKAYEVINDGSCKEHNICDSILQARENLLKIIEKGNY